MRLMMSLIVLLATAVSARAHFVFIVPGAGADSARVMMSEDLTPDEDVDVKLIGGAKLSSRSLDGQDTPLTLALGEHVYTTSFDRGTSRLLFGEANVGVMKRGDAPPHLLVYYPKTIVGDAFDTKAVLGDSAAIELVPAGTPGAVKLRLLVNGKPKANAEVTVVLPDHKEERVPTDANGETPVFAQTGRFGAWARDWQDKAGEADGKKYEQLRRYATLVFDVPAAVTDAKEPAATQASSTEGESRSRRSRAHGGASEPIPAATKIATLPEATSSFGAVTLDGSLYVYGGHIAPTHDYSTAAVSGKFWRAPLNDLKNWEALQEGPAMQGMNLAAYGGAVYRVGGMQPMNAPEVKEDIRSIDSAVRFDPKEGKWHDIAPLPEPRSSHDLAVIGDTLYVVGGWNLRSGQSALWFEDMLTLDLKDPDAKWVSHPQPFSRRALITAVHNGKLYVLGGFDSDDRASKRVDVYDPGTQAWSQAPGLLGPSLNGFAPAACEHEGELYVSVGDGNVYRLDESDNQWEPVATNTPRIVHRMIPSGEHILIIGGASKGENHDLIESITPEAGATQE